MFRVRHVRWRIDPVGLFELSSLVLNRTEPLNVTRRGCSHAPLAAASPGRDDRWSRPPHPVHPSLVPTVTRMLLGRLVSTWMQRRLGMDGGDRAGLDEEVGGSCSGKEMSIPHQSNASNSDVSCTVGNSCADGKGLFPGRTTSTARIPARDAASASANTSVANRILLVSGSPMERAIS